MQRGLFLDRDGVINLDRGYVSAREQFTFTLGIFPFLREAQDRGFRLVIVTNQSGVARGLYSEEDYQSLTRWMLGALGQEGISISLVLACFEHAEGTVEPYCRASYWRKPNPGMILEASQRLRLDLPRSAMIGDQLRDMEAAEAAGIPARLLLTKDKSLVPPPGATPITDFAQALDKLA